MNEARVADLLAKVHTLRCLEELRGFREQLRDQGEQMTAAVFTALETKAAFLGKKERR